MQRRRFLQLAATVPLAALVGCGGGGGDNNTPPPPPVDRSTVAGNLRQQIELFNTTNVRLGATWQGTSPALDALRGVVTRALPGVRTPLQATAIGLDGARVVFERLCNQTLALDDLGFVAGAVSEGNALTGSSNLNNPTWLAGMFAQNIASLQVTGALASIFQVGGLGELRAWVLARPDAQSRLVAYAIAAEIVNTWVDSVCAGVGVPASSGWKLAIGADVTADAVPDQLDRLLAIVLALPFGPGLRPGAGTDDAALGAGVSNFVASLLGALTSRIFSGASLASLDPAAARFDIAARLAGKGILTALAALPGGIARAQELADSWLSSTNPDDWPGGNADAIGCQIQIVATAYAFFNALRASMMESQSAFGSIVLANAAVAAFDATDAAIATCGSVYQKALWERQDCARKILRDFRFLSGSIVTERRIPESSIVGLEFDQLAFGGASRTRVTLCIEVELGTDKARGLGVAASRALVAGRVGGIARTYIAVGNAAANLLADLTARFAVELAGEWREDGMFSFVPSDFASFIRREPGAEFATVPAISQATLLCAGPGFLPSRSTGTVNLATIGALPILSPLTNLTGGVPIHVN
jgi:hypothetical protein